ncbi:MAG: sulfatase [Candidatus Sumerlaeota bacterium]|nr:sulfatase [Candidatus Sumerlaeota bacterium]
MPAKTTRARKRPNIFIYMIDTARRGNMSCYGYHRPTTPHIARIAEEGAIFDNHFVTSCWSLPSQVSFMTGQHLCGHGCGVQYQFLEPGIPTLAEILNRAGYYTAAIQPNPWVQQDEGQCMRGWTNFRRPGGLTRLQEPNKPNRKEMQPVPPYLPVPGESDTGMCWKMVGWVEDWLERSAPRDKPWALFVLTGETHMKCWPPRKYREQFLPPGFPDEAAGKIPQDQFGGTAGMVKLTAPQWEIVRCLRDGAMAYVDRAIGEIFDNMRKRGALDDTIFVVTSDHGDSHGEHRFHTGHCQTHLWDTMLHTPLVMRYPRRIPKGVRVPHLAANIDVLPTLLDLCGVKDREADKHVHGKSLVPAIKGKPVRDFVMAELQKPLEPMHLTAKRCPGFDYRVYNRREKSARTLEWKYIWTSDARDELYNVIDDPDEQKNVIAEHRDVAEGLRLKMEDLLLSIDQRDFGDCLKHTGHVQVDPEIERRLAAWGIYRRIIGAPVKK